MDKNMLKNLDNNLSQCLKNKYVNYGLIVLCVLYAAFGSDNVSSDMLAMFDNSLVRLVVLVAISYVSYHSPVVGIVLAMCYVITVQNLNQGKVSGLPVEGYWADSQNDNDHDNDEHNEHDDKNEDHSDENKHERKSNHIV